MEPAPLSQIGDWLYNAALLRYVFSATHSAAWVGAATIGRLLPYVRVHLGPGDSFGERGLLDSAPRNATVTTEMDTIVLWIDGDVLLESLEAAPTLTPALNLSSTAPGVYVPPDKSSVLDDPTRVEA